MDVPTAKHALGAMASLLNEGRSRALNDQEKMELGVFCEILDKGIEGRAIYNFGARQFSRLVRFSGLLETGTTDDLESLITEANSLRNLLG